MVEWEFTTLTLNSMNNPAMMILFILIACLGVSHGSIIYPEVHQPQPYSFGYTINDHEGAQHRQETGNGAGVVKGNYGFVDARGIHRQVDYVADHGGFRAQVKTNEPGTSNQSPAAVHVIANPQIHGMHGFPSIYGHRAYGNMQYVPPHHVPLQHHEHHMPIHVPVHEHAALHHIPSLHGHVTPLHEHQVPLHMPAHLLSHHVPAQLHGHHVPAHLLGHHVPAHLVHHVPAHILHDHSSHYVPHHLQTHGHVSQLHGYIPSYEHPLSHL